MENEWLVRFWQNSASLMEVQTNHNALYSARQAPLIERYKLCPLGNWRAQRHPDFSRPPQHLSGGRSKLTTPLRRHFRAVLQDAAALLAGSGLRSAAEGFSSR
jgi:hypothetical protein